MLLKKGVLKICSKFTGEHPFAAYFRAPFPRNTFGGLLLCLVKKRSNREGVGEPTCRRASKREMGKNQNEKVSLLTKFPRQSSNFNLQTFVNMSTC